MIRNPSASRLFLVSVVNLKEHSSVPLIANSALVTSILRLLPAFALLLEQDVYHCSVSFASGRMPDAAGWKPALPFVFCYLSSVRAAIVIRTGFSEEVLTQTIRSVPSSVRRWPYRKFRPRGTTAPASVKSASSSPHP